MQTKITIRNEAQTCYIDIEGTIGVEREDAGSSGVATYEEFRREVERIAQVAAQRVVVNIRSTGGDVNDALLIYEALMGLEASVTTRCYGYTASAATIIAQAADEGCREISSNAMYLIHRSMCAIEGNTQALESRADLLKKTDERLAQLYALHSGGDAEEYARLMAENNGEGRWLTPQETVEWGLADRVIDSAAQGTEQQVELLQSLMPVASVAVATEADVVAEAVESGQTQQSGQSQQSGKGSSAKPKGGQRGTTQQSVKRMVQRLAGELLQYLFSRLASRWEQWVSKKQAQREEREQNAAAATSTEEGADAGADAGCGSAEMATIDAGCGTSESGAATLVESSAVASPQLPTAKVGLPTDEATAMRRSTIAFEQGQSRFTATTLKPVEDPLMGAPHALSNEKAYMDDVKAFSR